jgi:hypothetical protein
MDAMGPDEEDPMEESPNKEVQRFFVLLKAAQSPLWDGCYRYYVLSASLTALNLKADYGFSEDCFNALMQFMGNALPDNNCMPKS